jgi:hypothetical protein
LGSAANNFGAFDLENWLTFPLKDQDVARSIKEQSKVVSKWSLVSSQMVATFIHTMASTLFENSVAHYYLYIFLPSKDTVMLSPALSTYYQTMIYKEDPTNSFEGWLICM